MIKQFIEDLKMFRFTDSGELLFVSLTAATLMFLAMLTRTVMGY